jgi:hypothetical protein
MISEVSLKGAHTVGLDQVLKLSMIQLQLEPTTSQSKDLYQLHMLTMQLVTATKSVVRRNQFHLLNLQSHPASYLPVKHFPDGER